MRGIIPPLTRKSPWLGTWIQREPDFYPSSIKMAAVQIYVFSSSPKHDTCPDKRILLDVITRMKGDGMEYFRLTTGHDSLAARLFVHPNVCLVPRRYGVSVAISPPKLHSYKSREYSINLKLFWGFRRRMDFLQVPER